MNKKINKINKMKKEVIKQEKIKDRNILTVKYTPSKIEKFFGKKEKEKQFIDSDREYSFGGVSVWLNYPECTNYGRYELLDVYLRKLKYQKDENLTKNRSGVITVPLVLLNFKNFNNHIYKDNENLRDSIKDFNDRVKKIGVVYGEYGYPNGNFDTSLSRVSHTIKNVRIEGNKVVGDIKMLNTNYGKILQSEIDQIVFRPRIAGIVDENGLVVIKKLFTFDAISKDTDAFFVKDENI